MAFTQYAATLPELIAQVPLMTGGEMVKNREAHLHRPASVFRPTEIRHVQQCVQWALKHGASLTVIGGGHSGHCVWPNVVAIDMSAFDQVHILTPGADGEDPGSDFNPGPLVIAGAGCKTGDIIGRASKAALTVPLGACLSVGVGLWLQGGIGYLARQHGIACDAIVGAVVVSVASGEVLCVGRVPRQHRPASAVVASPGDDADLLWALKGAGTNFGVVLSVAFKACAAPTYWVRNWVVPLHGDRGARRRLAEFDARVASQLPRNHAADAYLYFDAHADRLCLGVTMFESLIPGLTIPKKTAVDEILGPKYSFKAVDGIGVFETEMYISVMHGGHGGGKTSSFKRCLFLKGIGTAEVAESLVAAIQARPSPLCYLHLLHGGGAVGDVAADTTAFGCRDWDFACVVTGVWPREEDGTEAARAAVRWVYRVAGDLLPLGTGAYGADLGPDPRDAALAAKAFGPNLPRLARLKRTLDPHNILAYACPLSEAPVPVEPKLVILVTGECGAGKDYCADVWVSIFITETRKYLTARPVSISDGIKREYAAATGADVDRLLRDRAYKEQHRPALDAFFQTQVRQRPRLPEEHFLKVVQDAAGVDVLLITGMRDEALVPSLSHLVPSSRLLEVRVQAREETRRVRRGFYGGDNGNMDNESSKNDKSNSKALDYHPSLIFDNNSTGNEAAKKFAKDYLLPLVHEDLQRFADMVCSVPDFPRPGIEFRHVLGISQQPDGLDLCTSLLQTHFTDDWAKVGAIACCEAGGFVFAPALAFRVGVPLTLIREVGKLPPPTVSVVKSPSHISSPESNSSMEERIEIEQDVLPRGTPVVVVDDVLATGKTLCAVLRLLEKTGIRAENVSVLVVAEFPIHRGRDLVRRCGFGKVNIQSLLVFGGA